MSSKALVFGFQGIDFLLHDLDLALFGDGLELFFHGRFVAEDRALVAKDIVKIERVSL